MIIPCHCVKGVQIPSFSWSVFSRIGTGKGDLPRKSPYSVRIRGNTDQKKSVFGNVSQSVCVFGLKEGRYQNISIKIY